MNNMVQYRNCTYYTELAGFSPGFLKFCIVIKELCHEAFYPAGPIPAAMMAAGQTLLCWKSFGNIFVIILFFDDFCRCNKIEYIVSSYCSSLRFGRYIHEKHSTKNRHSCVIHDWRRRTSLRRYRYFYQF